MSTPSPITSAVLFSAARLELEWAEKEEFKMDRYRTKTYPLLLVVAVVLTGASYSGAETTESSAETNWKTDYTSAYEEAKTSGKLLLVYFHSPTIDATCRSFEESTLSDAEIKESLADFVLAKVPTTAETNLEDNPIRLLDHGAFEQMRGQQGIAIIDLKNKERSFYGKTVSCLPFEQPVYFAPKYWGIQSMRTLLNLPPGSITQRTLTYAIRCHPEGPASTEGHPHPVLFEACAQHSQHQASILNQGHHNWSSRFQEIYHQIGGQPPIEVCAESWPGENLLEASFSCVSSWRQSSGHWGAIRARQPAFGYDIIRGSNGVWYATGIFGGVDVSN